MKISVCMATYNGEKFVKEQIDSILCQLGQDDEIIISDDGSSDNTINIIESYGDSRIKLYHHNTERGYTKNFENALQHATGDIFFLSDQDDVWTPGKVNVMKAALNNSNLAMSDAIIVDEKLQTIYPSHFQRAKVKAGFWHNFAKTRYVGACMAFDKNVYNAILPFPNNQKLCVHDYWITLLSECCFKVKLINEPLIKYRRHDNNLTGETSSRTMYVKIFSRIYTLKQILVRYICI